MRGFLRLRVYLSVSEESQLHENESSQWKSTSFVKQLFTMSPQRSKNQGSSPESGGTCVCERNQPRDAACRYRTDPFTAAFAGLQF